MIHPSPRPADKVQAVETSGSLLGDLEEALDQFEKELYVMADTASDWPGGSKGSSEAEALEWHLVDTARRLHAASDACRACQQWSTRLLASDPNSVGMASRRDPDAQ